MMRRRHFLRFAGAAATLVVAGGVRRTKAASAETVALQHTALAGVRDDGDLPGVTVLTSRMLLSGTPRRPSDLDMKSAATLAGGTLTRGTTSEVSSIACVMPAT